MDALLPAFRTRHLSSRLRFVFFVLLVFVLSVPVSTLHAQQSQLKIFKLKSRMAADIIPVIEPLLQGQGAVTGMRDQLIVRTTPQNLQMVEQLLAQLDTPLRNLRITVRQGMSGTRDRTRVQRGDLTLAADPRRLVLHEKHIGRVVFERVADQLDECFLHRCPDRVFRTLSGAKPRERKFTACLRRRVPRRARDRAGRS